ncbi:hypothetical protein [Lactiplantibacillus fabifermentans]|uniref:Uncharacterized protein n=2 Tax=Lactiplantibacillus fabifermentans TaxID=483011 RepID=A0A0R2NP45_9LACO|nr:hypothetical protein [Lactiplantibacillus fabifermentans]ETY73570.1 hypothetical protein LFAB_11710 [Lactiplantibacillus fabifermentans T30PCM01]KRO27463.1 hypothetical protein DY78_GL003211 [Lactiplantibacillus fabifermentans DSM 21115]
MQRYALQQTGHDFEPITPWDTNPQPILTQLKGRDDVDLLTWNPHQDMSEIYPQYDLASLVERVDGTPVAKLIDQLSGVLTALALPSSDQIQQQWYLVGDLAALTHPGLINTAAALLSLTVVALKTPLLTPKAVVSRKLHSLANQARCWLLAAKVTDLQLIATPAALTKLLQHLLAQTAVLDNCSPTSRAVSGELAQDAYWLSLVDDATFDVTQLNSPVAWSLLRAAHLENNLK